MELAPFPYIEWLLQHHGAKSLRCSRWVLWNLLYHIIEINQ